MYVNAQKLIPAEAVHLRTIIRIIPIRIIENVLKTVVMPTKAQAVIFLVITALIARSNNIKYN